MSERAGRVWRTGLRNIWGTNVPWIIPLLLRGVWLQNTCRKWGHIIYHACHTKTCATHIVGSCFFPIFFGRSKDSCLGLNPTWFESISSRKDFIRFLPPKLGCPTKVWLTNCDLLQVRDAEILSFCNDARIHPHWHTSHVMVDNYCGFEVIAKLWRKPKEVSESIRPRTIYIFAGWS